MLPEDCHIPVVLRVELDQCLGCAVCADVCPAGALVMDRTDLAPRPLATRCTACALCVQQCPTGALALVFA